MDELDAKIIIILSQVEMINRNIHYLIYKLQYSYMPIDRRLKNLVYDGFITKGFNPRDKRKTFFIPTPEAIEEAKKILMEVGKSEWIL